MKVESSSLDGYLLVDKPVGLTSHDVVAKIRHLLSTNGSQLSAGRPKVGHTGTLDPLASGLMIIVVGSYTKRAAEFSKLDKTYEVELTLGYTSKTGDAEGPIEKSSEKTVDRRQLEKVLESLIGGIWQTPHAHSAVKVAGERAYKLARQGKEFKIKPRQVTIYSLRSTTYQYPKLCFTARVSSGTYIRSLAEDIGQKLGTGAYVSALRRTQVGSYEISTAKKLENLSENDIIKQ